MYKWWHYLHAKTGSKRPLRLSLDETSVKFWPSARAGNLYVGFDSTRSRAKSASASRVTLQDARCCMTHVALICDDPAIQPLLPQVLICRKTSVRVHQVDAISDLLPPNFKVLVTASAWTNENIMLYIIGLLATALAPFTATRQPILFMDTAPSHLHASIVQKCYEKGVWLGLVPAGTTWAFQVLDTHCFGPFKQVLARRQTDTRSRLGGERLTIVQWIECFVKAATTVLQGVEWASAFDDNGFSRWDVPLRSELMKELAWEVLPPVNTEKPTLEDMKIVWPRTKRVPMSTLENCFNHLPLAPLALLGPPVVAAPALPGITTHMTPPRRLRSKTSFAADHVPAAHVGSSVAASSQE